MTLKQKRGLMHDRFVLLKRERDLNDEERLNLDGWTKNYPALGEAYRLKEDFYGIYEAGTPEEAMRRYEAWYRAISTGVSEFLCKRFGLQWMEMRSPNSMVKRVSAAFQSRMGMLHFWLMLRSAR